MNKPKRKLAPGMTQPKVHPEVPPPSDDAPLSHREMLEERVMGETLARKQATHDALDNAIRVGLSALHRPEPMSLSEWAAENFYLSAESSYVQGSWEAFPFQLAILDAISNDDIREVWFPKSARVGATKMMLAAVGYFAEHRKRNQAIWQPVDDDADEFTKTEIDPMLRDVPALQQIFPHYNVRNKYNTLRQKQFIGSMLHIRGGKSAKNYRRLSVDVAFLDELDAFDPDVEHEGDPVTLASKRVEGSIFPKVVAASTPKTKGASLIEQRSETAEHYFRYFVPCPHCDHEQNLVWGGPDFKHGMKWDKGAPETARYRCIECAGDFTQGEYLAAADSGRWRSVKADHEGVEHLVGVYIDRDGMFRTDEDHIVQTPASVAFHIWTAYSPMTSWEQIVREFIRAKPNRETLKTFVNTTLGETWQDEETEELDEEILYRRRERYHHPMPEGANFITVGIDTQDDRFEILFDAWGAGEERWSLSYHRLYGDPTRHILWDRLAELLRGKTFAASDGTLYQAAICCQDHGGHFGDEVTAFSKRLGTRFLVPVKGSSVYGKPVATFPRKPNKNRVYLTEVGTDTAKDLLFQRLNIFEEGEGFWHFPLTEDFDRQFFHQLTAEKRITRWAQGQRREVWVDTNRPHEAWDCAVYSFAACRIAQQFLGMRLTARQVGERKAPAALKLRRPTKMKDPYL